MSNLSPAQRRVVEHPAQQGHVLVLAAAGSGKTRIISERVAHLLGTRQAQPESLLAMTFTIKASQELAQRLRQGLGAQAEDIWAGTFHSICARLLREHGAAIGWPPPFTIYDSSQQEQVLRRAAGQAGLDVSGRRSLSELKQRISRRKRLGLQADQQPFDAPADPDEVLAADELYRELLVQERALDYDDLLLNGIRLLKEDHEAAESLRRRFQYVFVDEFHDVSLEQLELLKALAPPRSPQQALVVADPNQAIFGWRGADAQRVLDSFRRQYRPVLYALAENYRSAGKLVRAAAQVMTAGGASVLAGEVHADGLPIYCAECKDVEHEADWLARQIRRACDSGYSYGDIAVLYRFHSRADTLESQLLQAGIPLRRIQQERFFDRPDVQNTLRYMALVEALRDESFETALSWPRAVVDELTMVQLRRLARADGISFSALARRIDAYRDRVSPLARAAIREVLKTYDEELAAVGGQPVDVVLERLLAVLGRRRSPFPNAVRADLHGVYEFLARPLQSAVAQLYAAVQTGMPVVLCHSGELDSAAAAVVLEHVLTHYLQHPVTVERSGVQPGASRFIVGLGIALPAGSAGVSLAVRSTRAMRYSITTQAWRLGQQLLMRYESLRDDCYTCYDLETTGRQVGTAEIVELAALTIEAGRPVGEPFQSLVRPQGPIAGDATRIHGIRWSDVQDAPTPAEILPAFFEFLTGATLVGHNIEQFDHPLLRRVAREAGLPLPEHFLVDTCALARRLLPNAAHSLESLAQRFDLQAQQRHRALDDVRLNAAVFNHLLDLLQREQELDVLAEALPLVALSIDSAGVPLQDENEWLAQAGARAASAGLGDALRVRLHEVADDQQAVFDAERRLATLPLAASEDDAQWDELAGRWRQAIEHYCRSVSDQSVQAFLQYVQLATPLDEQLDAESRVTLMTIYAAKGMEWPLVFLLGAEDGTLPSWKAESPEVVEEERRVLYVAMTRAVQRLCLTWVSEHHGYSRRLSRFLSDLPEELMLQKAIQSDW